MIELDGNPRNPYDLLYKNHTPSEVIASLLSEREYCEKALAHPNIPQRYLFEYAKSSSLRLREAVASNPNLPLSLLEELAEDDDLKLPNPARTRIACHPQTPLKILLQDFARETTLQETVARVIMQKNCDERRTDKIIDIFAEESASPLEKILQRLIEEGGFEPRLFLARRWDLPGEFLTQLATSPEVEIRELVAQHPNTPTSTVEDLAQDSRATVRLNTAGRDDLSNYAVQKLIKDSDRYVRDRVTVNPRLSSETKKQILSSACATEFLGCHPHFLSAHSDIVPSILDYYVDSRFPAVRYVALSQPQIFENTLEQKSISRHWLDRLAVAQNPRTPLAVLQQLTADANSLVRAAARDGEMGRHGDAETDL